MNVQDAGGGTNVILGLKIVDRGLITDTRDVSSHPMTQVATKRATSLVLWPFLVFLGHTLQQFGMNEQGAETPTPTISRA